MKEIKFRGRDLDTGKFVYGDFVHCVPMSSFPGIVDDDGSVHEVYFDSVAQLAGYDANGKEIYDDDTITVTWEEKNIVKDYVVSFRSFAYAKDGCYLCQCQLKNGVLKEAPHAEKTA